MDKKPIPLFQSDHHSVQSIVSKYIELLSQGPSTREQGIKNLNSLIPILNENSLPLFIVTICKSKKEQGNITTKRELVKILGSVIDHHKEKCKNNLTLIVNFIFVQLYQPSGSVEKMHRECSTTLIQICKHINLNFILKKLFENYSKIQLKSGEENLQIQQGISTIFQNIFVDEEIKNKLKSNENILTKIVEKFVNYLHRDSQLIPGEIMKNLGIIIENYENVHKNFEKYLPEIISYSIQILSEGSVSTSSPNTNKNTELMKINSSNQTQYKNRLEASKLLFTLANCLPITLLSSFIDEVLHYLTQCRYDRVFFSNSRELEIFLIF